MIMRIYRGVVATERVAEYVRYMELTALTDYADVPGSEGAQMVTRDVGQDRTEVLTVSWWESLEALRRFAGHDIAKPKFYAEDSDFLLEPEQEVQNYVVAGDFPKPPSADVDAEDALS